MISAHPHTGPTLDGAGETPTVVPVGRRGRVRSMVARHPVTAFLICGYGLGWPLLTVRTTTSIAPTFIGVAFTYVALLGSALAVTWAGGGFVAVRAFLARFLLWRLGPHRGKRGGRGLPRGWTRRADATVRRTRAPAVRLSEPSIEPRLMP